MRILYWVDVAVFFVLAGNVLIRIHWSVVSVVGIAMVAAGFVLWMWPGCNWEVRLR